MAAQELLRAIKPWLELSEAEARVTTRLGEKVNAADLLRISIAGKLPLYIELRGSINARCANIEPSESDEFSDRLVYEPPFLGGLRGMFRLWSREGMPWHFVNVHGELESELGGIHVCAPEGQRVVEILNRDGSAAQTLPNGCSVLIRTEDIDALTEEPHRPVDNNASDADELRALEAFGLLVEVYASQRGHGYQNGDRPNVSRVVEDMLGKIPEGVTKMGERKLKDQLSAATKAWETKKQS